MVKPAGSFALNVNGYMVTTEKGETEASFGTEVGQRADVQCHILYIHYDLFKWMSFTISRASDIIENMI